MEKFDPYRKWLGIPESQQPPNHYRLLGIDPFESDSDTIQLAADRQMAFVRKFQNGPHVADSQRLCGELVVACRCLLDAEKRAAYDVELRAQVAGPQETDDTEVDDEQELPEAANAFAQLDVGSPPTAPRGSTSRSAGSRGGLPRKRANVKKTARAAPMPAGRKAILSTVLTIGGGVSGLLLAGLILWFFGMTPWSARVNPVVAPPVAENATGSTNRPAANATPSQPHRGPDAQKTGAAPLFIEPQPGIGPGGGPVPGPAVKEEENPFKVIGPAPGGNAPATTARTPPGAAGEANPFQPAVAPGSSDQRPAAPRTITPPADATAVGGHHFKLFHQRVSWSDAKQQCEQMGGHLLCIETPDKLTIVRQWRLPPVWLGIVADRGSWRWLTGPAVGGIHIEAEGPAVFSLIDGNVQENKKDCRFVCEWPY